MKDSPARTDPEEAAIGRPTPTARRLVEASVSPNTRRAYAGALRRLDAWLDGRELDDAALAAYLAELHDAGRASSSASMAVAAACFRAKLAGQPTPAGERTARVLAGYRRTASDRGRGPAGERTARVLAGYRRTASDRGRGPAGERTARVLAGYRRTASDRGRGPAGERTARVLAGYRRTASDRGRGQARPFGLSDLAAVFATCHRCHRGERRAAHDGFGPDYATCVLVYATIPARLSCNLTMTRVSVLQ